MGFWIHGGAFVHGSGADPTFNGVNLVKNGGQDLIIVTINYRLGPLGFLASEQLYDEDPNWPSYGGMNGIYDQIIALEWVKKYISDYGGNPDQITIFGESAGGLSVCMLCITKMVKNNTFQRAIQESGACGGPWSPFVLSQALVTTQQDLLQHNLSTNITELRNADAFDFQFDAFNPSIDDLLLTELPVETYKKLGIDGYNVQEIIIGFNSMDGIIGFPYLGGSTPNGSVEYNEYISNYISNETQVKLIENVYYPLSDFPSYHNRTSSSIAWQTINGDVCVACPSLKQIMNIVQGLKSNIKGYIYEFRGGGTPFYAPHASEIPFVFDHETNETFFDVKWNQLLSDQMANAWTNMIKYGLPNITINNDNIVWKEFSMNDENIIIFDDNVRIETDYFESSYRNGACKFWYEEIGLIGTMQEICYDLNP